MTTTVGVVGEGEMGHIGSQVTAHTKGKAPDRAVRHKTTKSDGRLHLQLHNVTKEPGEIMKGPEFSSSQKIGALGKRVFTGGHPDSWHQEGEPQQGGDFGFDVSMWLTGLGEIRGRFSVQLKSTTDAKVRGQNGDAYYSVVLTKEACELYFQDGQPVMLVLVVLDGEKTDGAKMYYAWITDQRNL